MLVVAGSPDNGSEAPAVPGAPPCNLSPADRFHGGVRAWPRSRRARLHRSRERGCRSEVEGDGFRARYREQFADPAFEPLAAEIERSLQSPGTPSEHRKSPHTRKAGPGFADPDYDLSVDWLAARDAIHAAAGAARRRPGRRASSSSTARRAASTPARARCRRAGGWPRSRAKRSRRRGVEVETARPVAAGVRVRAQHPSLQGLLLDRGAALPLAVLLLSELFARPDAGLDERHLSDVGGGARHHDRHAGQLVPGHLAAQADDGPAGLRRRRQSRSDPDPRQGRREGQGGRARRLGLSAPSRRPAVLGGRPRRRRGRGERAPLDLRLAGFMRLAPGRRPLPSSTATSATGSPTPPATRSSTRTRQSRRRCATPPGPSPKRLPPAVPGPGRRSARGSPSRERSRLATVRESAVDPAHQSRREIEARPGTQTDGTFWRGHQGSWRWLRRRPTMKPSEEWAEARDGHPARVKGTGSSKDAGLLRLDFGEPEESLEVRPGKSSSRSSKKASSRFSTKTSPTTGSASLSADRVSASNPEIGR